MIGAEGACGQKDLPGAERLSCHRRVDLFRLGISHALPERDGGYDHNRRTFNGLRWRRSCKRAVRCLPQRNTPCICPLFVGNRNRIQWNIRVPVSVFGRRISHLVIIEERETFRAELDEFVLHECSLDQKPVAKFLKACIIGLPCTASRTSLNWTVPPAASWSAAERVPAR